MFGPKVIYGTKICFIGLGKLGLPCAEAFVKKGFDVSGYDVLEPSTQNVTKFISIEGAVKDREIIFILYQHHMKMGTMAEHLQAI